MWSEREDLILVSSSLRLQFVSRKSFLNLMISS